MNKYLEVILKCFLMLAVVMSILYCAMSFSAMSLNPFKWASIQRDIFSLVGVFVSFVIGSIGVDILLKEKK